MPNVYLIINGTSPFPILGLLGGKFHFNSNFNRNFCKQTLENLIRRRVLWRLVLSLHGLLMSHKMDARLKWVKHFKTFSL